VSGCRPENVAKIHGYPRPAPYADAENKPAFDESTRLKEHSAEGIPLPDPAMRANWPRNREIFKKDTVYFDFDSSTLKSSEKKKVADVADYLKKNRGNGLEVEGHCDERGTDGYNRSLGERRALALREELARLGVDPMMIDTVSYGKDHPAVPGHDEAAWRKNRRGEFLLEIAPGKTQ
jgi:peptidoglycan-associated lipoprotein